MRTFGLVVALCVLAAGPVAAQSDIVRRNASILGTHREAIGQVSVVGSAHATLIRITIQSGGLTPGWHGVHFHAVGDCSDAGQYLAAKGIVDRVGRSHGLLNPDGPKEGDLPNIYAAPDGSVNVELLSHAVRMLGPTGLVEGPGSALIIHANEDDQITQPVGGAGGRVACAVIK
jgi:Cu-Zn family superoxide dismutase